MANTKGNAKGPQTADELEAAIREALANFWMAAWDCAGQERTALRYAAAASTALAKILVATDAHERNLQAAIEAGG